MGKNREILLFIYLDKEAPPASPAKFAALFSDEKFNRASPG